MAALGAPASSSPRWLVVIALCSLLPLARAGLWDFEDPFVSCYSDINITGAQAMDRKGFVMDDVTLRWCPSRIPADWPNSGIPVGSLRLFRSWADGWPEERRGEVWQNLLGYVKKRRVKVMVATPVSCDVQSDERDWLWTRELLTKLDPDQVMGFAVGNELDLLYTHAKNDPACIQSLWEDGRAWAQFTQRVQAIDQMGLGHVPVTSVFTAGILYGGNRYEPFSNVHGQALINDFLKNATRTYGYRYTFTFNIYPYFDPSLKIQPPKYTCASGLNIATCFEDNCLVSKALILARQKMQQLTGRGDDRLWIGEMGWSSPQAMALGTEMATCPEFSSLGALTRFYQNFLRWDMKVTGIREPDHAFYFTMRDALNFGFQEYFGVISTCQALECKIKTLNYTAPPILRGHRMVGMRGGFLAFGVALLVVALCPVLCQWVTVVASKNDDEDGSASDFSESSRSSE